MKKKREEKLSVWTAVFVGVWMVDDAGELITREGTVRAFTVASDKEDAILTMHNGLLHFDDIEDVGKATNIRCIRGDFIKKIQPIIFAENPGYQFIPPFERLAQDKGAIGFLVHFWLKMQPLLKKEIKKITKGA